jgi:hypothetical protein
MPRTTERTKSQQRLNVLDDGHMLAETFNTVLVNTRPPLWSSSHEFLATDPEVPGSISGPIRFSEKQRVWNGVHSAS